MDQSGPDFQSEIAELLERFFQDLEKLREEFADVSARRNLIGSIFRRVHSLKGCANTAALEETGKIAHHLEDLLADIRDHKVELTESLLDLIEDAGNLITASLGPAPPAGTSIEGFLSYLQAVERTRLPAHGSDCPPTLPSDIWQSLNETQQRHLVRALDDGLELYIITTSFDIADFDQQFYRLKETLDDLGEVISTYPSVGFAQTHGINFRILFVMYGDFLQAAAEDVNLKTLSIQKVTATTRTTPLQDLPGSQMLNPVRLPAHELDKLSAPLNALSQLTNQALQMAIAAASPEKRSLLALRATEISQSFLDFQNQLADLRLVSLGQVLKRAERAGKAAARLSGKAVSFEISGADVRIDASVAAATADPLVHLLRNAVDHGIENVAERLHAGKTAQGHIRIEAGVEEGAIYLRVTDDGRGVDLKLVGEAAVQSGLISQDEVLTTEGSLRLLFRPGFSTAKRTSTTSGRGVGLDIVQTAIKQIGGEVRVVTEAGKGSTFELQLPVPQ